MVTVSGAETGAGEETGTGATSGSTSVFLEALLALGFSSTGAGTGTGAGATAATTGSVVLVDFLEDCLELILYDIVRHCF